VRRGAAHQGTERDRRLDADVEHAPVDRQVAFLVPVEESRREVVELEPPLVEQRREETERLGAVVGPGAGRNAAVGATEAVGWGHLDELRVGDRLSPVKLVRNPERVANEEPEQTPLLPALVRAHGHRVSLPGCSIAQKESLTPFMKHP